MTGSRRILRASAPFLVALAVALPALGLTGCRSRDVVGRGPAAVVNGHEISRTDVERKFEELKKQVDPSALQDPELIGTGTDTLGGRAASFVLNELIQAQIKKSVGPEDRARLDRYLYPQVAAQDPYCLSAIYVADREGLVAAQKALAAGVDFAQVSSTLTVDPQLAQRGGDVGCASAQQLEQQFGVDVSQIKKGDLIDPVAFDQGILLLRIDSVENPPLERVKPRMDEVVDKNGLQQTLQAAGLLRVRVEVDPRYGTWDPKTSSVVPVEGPLTTTTTVPTPLVRPTP